MKHSMNKGLAMMAITVGGLTAGAPAKANGRIIEFKSGPEGFDTKTFFYEGADEVIAFDAQFTPELARQAIARVREVTTKPITWLVITHPNPDKFNGAPVFQAAGAKVIASRATAQALPGVHAYKENFFVNAAQMFAPGAYPKLATVDETFQDRTDLVLKGGERIELRELANPGVSSTQMVARIASVNALVVGDLVHHGVHAWLEGGVSGGGPRPTLAGWIADLEELRANFPADSVVYGGRGEAGLLGQVGPEQIAYLRAADSLVQTYVRELGARRVELKGAEAQKHFSELQRRFERELPGRGLGYLIQYGVYGLVLSKL